MTIIDHQLKHNDCGISAVKIICNILDKDISRNYIKEHIFLNEKGSRLSDIKTFFEESNFSAEYKLIDINSIKNISYFKGLFPFILPIKKKNELHYVVANGIKKNKIKIYDPSKGKVYFISLDEFRKISHSSNQNLDLVNLEDKLGFLIDSELNTYNISIDKALEENDKASLFNKLTYFTYHSEKYGYKDKNTEQLFLTDLIFNQDISMMPKNFLSLSLKRNKIKIKAPIVLSIKANSTIKITSETKKETNVFIKLIYELGENKKLWYIYIFTALFAATITQLAVFINQILIDKVLPSFQMNLLILFAIGVGVFKLFSLVIQQYKRFISIHFGNILDKYFIKVFDNKLNLFSIQYTETYRRGDLMERLSDSLKLKKFFLRFFTKILVDITVSLYSLFILLYINWQLTSLVFVVMILYYIWFKIITPYLKNLERQRFQKKADLFSKIIEKIDGLKVIKSFKLENTISSIIGNSINNLLKIQIKLGYVNLLNTSIITIITTVASLLIIIFLAKMNIQNHVLSLGQIITFLALSGNIFKSLSSILNENLTLQEHQVILSRYYDFNEKEDIEIKDNKGIKQFEINKLELNNISFGFYPDKMIIDNLSLIINSNDKILIKGKNGSGKSTLSKLLASLYKPEKGSVVINDYDSSFYNTEILESKILLVSNEDILFNETIEFNISLGKKIKTKNMLKIAKEIGFYEFINSKQEKLDFIISENGKNLSTGQRKKILILRALFTKAEIIILDEVLSGIDNESRIDIETLINNINKTFILISHEPITHINFNKKFQINHGKLSII